MKDDKKIDNSENTEVKVDNKIALKKKRKLSARIRLLTSKSLKIINTVRSVLISIAIIYVIILTVLMVYNEITTDRLIIDAFSVYPGLEEKGYSGDVVAKQIMDSYFNVYDKASTLKDIKGIKPKWEHSNISVDIPGVGISYAKIQEIIKELFGKEGNSISGDIVHEGDEIKLTARIDNRIISVQDTSMSSLLRKTSEELILMTDPYVMASYLFVNKEVEKSKILIDSVMNKTDLVINKDESIYWFYLLSGRILEENEDYELAIKEFDKAILMNQEHDIAYYNKGVILMNYLSKNEEAVMCFDKCLEKNYYNWDAHFNLGVAHFNVANRLNKELKKIRKTNPDERLLKLKFDDIISSWNSSNKCFKYAKKDKKLNISKRLKINKLKMTNYYNMADGYSRYVNDNKKSMFYYMMALKLDDEVNDDYLKNNLEGYNNCLIKVLVKSSRLIVNDTLSDKSDLKKALHLANRATKLLTPNKAFHNYAKGNLIKVSSKINETHN